MQQAGFSAARLAQVTAAMQGYIERGEVPGVVTLVWRRGEIAQFDALGHFDHERSQPMARDTLFRIASMTSRAPRS